MKNNQTNLRFTRAAVYAALALWFIFALMLGIKGQYASGQGKPPLALGLTLLLPMLGFAIAYLRHGSVWALCQAFDLRVVTLLHVWRIIGLWFLVNYFQGKLSGGFALPAGIGDIIIGLTAVPMALAMSRRTPAVRFWFVAWNIFGLADLIVAVGTGILHSPSSIGILAGTGPTTLLMSQFPRCMIPTFFVPVFMLLHLLALARSREVGAEYHRSPLAPVHS